MNTIIAFNERELATVLAALRYWQRIGIRAACPEADIAGPDGLWPEEIDALCERINIEGDTTGMLEALKYVSDLPGGIRGSALTFAKDAARAAIAKAEGRADG